MPYQWNYLWPRVETKIDIIGDEDDPCWIWKGAHTKGGHKQRIQRAYDYTPYTTVSYARAYANLRVEGKTQNVHKILAEAKYQRRIRRMENVCGDTLCVKPEHWARHFADEGPSIEDMVPEEEDILELVDAMLGKHSVRCWQDIRDLIPPEDDVSDEQLRQALINTNREDLLP